MLISQKAKTLQNLWFISPISETRRQCYGASQNMDQLPSSGCLLVILEFAQYPCFSRGCVSHGCAGAQCLWNLFRSRKNDLCYESWQVWWVHFLYYNITYAVQAPASCYGGGSSAMWCSISRSHSSVGSVLGTYSVTFSVWNTHTELLSHFSSSSGKCSHRTPGLSSWVRFLPRTIQVPTSPSPYIKLNGLEEDAFLLMGCSESESLFTSYSWQFDSALKIMEFFSFNLIWHARVIFFCLFQFCEFVCLFFVCFTSTISLLLECS